MGSAVAEGCTPMSVLQARSQLGNAVKKSRSEGRTPERDSSVEDARRDLAAEKIAEFVTKTMATAPPLSADQRDRLAAILRGVTP
jgi:hypothetical protein